MPRSEFEVTVSEACAIVDKLTEGPQYGDARDEKLSAKAYVAEAMKNANTTEAKLRDLEKRLEGGTHPWMDIFLGETYRRALSTRVDLGCTLRPPAGGFHMLLGPHGGAATELVNVMAEAMQYNATLLDLVALATLRAVRESPMSFGHIENFDTYHGSNEARRRRLEELARQLPTVATQQDLSYEWVDSKKSLARICYTWKGSSTGIGMNDDDAITRLAAVAR